MKLPEKKLISASDADKLLADKFGKDVVTKGFCSSFLRCCRPTITTSHFMYFYRDDIDRILSEDLKWVSSNANINLQVLVSVIQQREKSAKTEAFMSVNEMARGLCDNDANRAGKFAKWISKHQDKWFSEEYANDGFTIPFGDTFMILVNERLKNHIIEVMNEAYRKDIPVITKPTLDGVNMAALSSAEVDTLMALLAKIKQ